MSARLIPADAQRAAWRGFIRTACQSLASVIPTSAIAVVATHEWLEGVVLGIVGALLTSLLAGATSYLSILADGIPADYRPDTGHTVADQPPTAPDTGHTAADPLPTAPRNGGGIGETETLAPCRDSADAVDSAGVRNGGDGDGLDR